MSYARFGSEGSDVYVYLGSSGYNCCACALREGDDLRVDPIYDTPEEMIEHLKDHVNAGWNVPYAAVLRLESEIAVCNCGTSDAGTKTHLDTCPAHDPETCPVCLNDREAGL